MQILVVDDEPAVRNAIHRILNGAGFRVSLAGGGQEALDSLATESADAVVLDVLMPDIDGLEVCRRIRAGGVDVPILMLTARDAVADRVAGLDAGADDYLVKPFALEELVARVRALLRRTTTDGGEKTLRFSDLGLDQVRREAWRGDRVMQLTRTEFSLLELLLQHPREVLTRSFIFESVWGFDPGLASNSLEVYIGYLRKKTEADSEPRLIHTVRGVGYVLKES